MKQSYKQIPRKRRSLACRCLLVARKLFSCWIQQQIIRKLSLNKPFGGVVWPRRVHFYKMLKKTMHSKCKGIHEKKVKFSFVLQVNGQYFGWSMGSQTEQSQSATETDTSGTNIVIRVAKQRACQNLESVKVTQKNKIDAKLFVCDLKKLSKLLKQF